MLDVFGHLLNRQSEARQHVPCFVCELSYMLSDPSPPQAAFRAISLDVFGHLLDLDHSFHLHRKTGQIMRILDRGTSSIQVGG